MAQNFERFGKYILLEKLASGGMAEVYLSKNTGANGVSKFVAIKRILPQYSDNEEFIEMFKEEAKIAVNLNHSNVVHIHEFGIERNQFYLVMEYVEGRNLRQIINELKKKNNGFQIDQIIYVIKEVAAGLDHAHRCLDGTTGKPLNITHRDMSPQNVMVSFEGEVKIIDFGIAKAENQLEATKAGTLKGKFGYMSPEQGDGQNIDLRTDVFSLGIVLWELLARDRLFSGNSEAAILRKIRECNIPSLRKLDPAIHPELEKIVNKALAKDKNLRYQTAAALHRDLNRFLNTHYPEFSPQDFSVFIKHAFADSYSEQKGKLVEFSNIQVPESGVETNTVTKFNEKYRQTHEQSLQEKTSTSLKNVQNNNSFDPHSNQNNNHQQQAHESLKLNVDQQISNNTQTKRFNDENNKNNNQSSQFTNTGSAGKTRKSTYNFEKTKSKQQSSLTLPAIFVVAIMLFGGAFYFYSKKNSPPDGTYANNNQIISTADINFCKTNPENQKCIEICKSEKKYCFGKNSNGIKPELAQQPTKVETNTQLQPKSGEMQLSSQMQNQLQKTYQVFITSDPIGANIYIDDRHYGTTPSKVELPADKELVLKLEPRDIYREKYFETKKTIKITANNMTFEEKLDLKRFGFLTINALNAGSQYELKINGETSPNFQIRQQIQVPAEKEILIEIKNSLGLKGIQKVIVRENTKQTVDMILKKVD